MITRYTRDETRQSNLKVEPRVIGQPCLRNFVCKPTLWVALGKSFEEFVYLAVEIYHRGTLPSATPGFQVGKNFENCKIHRRRLSAWVGQADSGKLELNNRNHNGNCQRLSGKRDQFETQSI